MQWLTHQLKHRVFYIKVAQTMSNTAILFPRQKVGKESKRSPRVDFSNVAVKWTAIAVLVFGMLTRASSTAASAGIRVRHTVPKRLIRTLDAAAIRTGARHALAAESDAVVADCWLRAR